MAGGNLSDAENTRLNAEPSPDHRATEPPPDACCRRCHYSLRGNVTNRCPECGRSFDPRDWRTIWLPGQDTWRLIALRSIRAIARAMRSPAVQWTLLACIATALVALMDLRSLYFWDNLLIALCSFVPGWVIWFVIVRQAASALLQRRATLLGMIQCWTISCALLAVPLSWTVGWDRCPHASYVYVGPGIVRRATIGKSCGNMRYVRTIWDHLLDRRGVEELSRPF